MIKWIALVIFLCLVISHLYNRLTHDPDDEQDDGYYD